MPELWEKRAWRSRCALDKWKKAAWIKHDAKTNLYCFSGDKSLMMHTPRCVRVRIYICSSTETACLSNESDLQRARRIKTVNLAHELSRRQIRFARKRIGCTYKMYNKKMLLRHDLLFINIQWSALRKRRVAILLNGSM